MLWLDHRVPVNIANQPKPTRPDAERWSRAWFYYLNDLACWLAMKTDCLIYGVKEED